MYRPIVIMAENPHAVVLTWESINKITSLSTKKTIEVEIQLAVKNTDE